MPSKEDPNRADELAQSMRRVKKAEYLARLEQIRHSLLDGQCDVAIQKILDTACHHRCILTAVRDPLMQWVVCELTARRPPMKPQRSAAEELWFPTERHGRWLYPCGAAIERMPTSEERFRVFPNARAGYALRLDGNPIEFDYLSDAGYFLKLHGVGPALPKPAAAAS